MHLGCSTSISIRYPGRVLALVAACATQAQAGLTLRAVGQPAAVTAGGSLTLTVSGSFSVSPVRWWLEGDAEGIRLEPVPGQPNLRTVVAEPGRSWQMFRVVAMREGKGGQERADYPLTLVPERLPDPLPHLFGTLLPGILGPHWLLETSGPCSDRFPLYRNPGSSLIRASDGKCLVARSQGQTPLAQIQVGYGMPLVLPLPAGLDRHSRQGTGPVCHLVTLPDTVARTEYGARRILAVDQAAVALRFQDNPPQAWIERLGPARPDAYRTSWIYQLPLLHRGLYPLAGRAGAGRSRAEDGAGLAARFVQPSGMTLAGITDFDECLLQAKGVRTDPDVLAALSGQRKLVVADPASHTIRCVYNRLVVTCGGSDGKAGYRDAGPGEPETARFNRPTFVAALPGTVLEGLGHLAVADSGNHRIRLIGNNGQIDTLAGNGEAAHRDWPPKGDPVASPGDASFNDPQGLAVGADGTLYVADRGNSCIRMITGTQQVATLAGRPGQPGWLDAMGMEARFANLRGLAMAGHFLYAADGFRIRRIDVRNGEVTTLPIGGPPDQAAPGFRDVPIQPPQGCGGAAGEECKDEPRSGCLGEVWDLRAAGDWLLFTDRMPAPGPQPGKEGGESKDTDRTDALEENRRHAVRAYNLVTGELRTLAGGPGADDERPAKGSAPGAARRRQPAGPESKITQWGLLRDGIAHPDDRHARLAGARGLVNLGRGPAGPWVVSTDDRLGTFEWVNGEGPAPAQAPVTVTPAALTAKAGGEVAVDVRVPLVHGAFPTHVRLAVLDEDGDVVPEAFPGAAPADADGGGGDQPATRESKDDRKRAGTDSTWESKGDAKRAGTDATWESKGDSKRAGTDATWESKGDSKRAGTDAAPESAGDRKAAVLAEARRPYEAKDPARAYGESKAAWEQVGTGGILASAGDLLDPSAGPDLDAVVQERRFRELVIPSGQNAEVWLRFPTPGRYRLRVTAVTVSGHSSQQERVFTIE